MCKLFICEGEVGEKLLLEEGQLGDIYYELWISQTWPSYLAVLPKVDGI